MTKVEAKNMMTHDQSTAIVIPRSMSSALPKQMTVKLKYYTPITLDAVGGGAAVNVFSASGCYDPDITGTGGQPRGLDQYFAFYAKGVVTSSKCTVKGFQTSNSDFSVSSCLVGCALLNTVTTYIAPKPYIEDPRCSWIQINQATFADQEAIMTYGAKSFFSYKDPIDESDLHFTSSINPTQQAFYHVWVGAINAVANPSQVFCQVLLEYNVTFFEPVALPSS